MTEDKNRQRRGARFRARRRAVDMLFEAEFRDVDPVGIVEERQELAKDPANQVDPVPDYTAKIITGVATTLDEIDTALASHLSSEWSLERLPAVDRAVLRVSAWELLHNYGDVPDKVAVDEGIGLAKEYGHDKTSGYVHAVLDSIGRDRRLAEKAAADAATFAKPAVASKEVVEDLIAGVVEEPSVISEPSTD